MNVCSPWPSAARLKTIWTTGPRPAFRAAVWNRNGQAVIDQRLASQPTQSRLIDILTRHRASLGALREGLADSIKRHVPASGGRRSA